MEKEAEGMPVRRVGPILLLWLPLLLISLLSFAGPLMTDSAAILRSETGYHPLILELAVTDEERRKGLMHRTSLAENHGMLFDMRGHWPTAMWMKNVPISLDVIFLDETGRVIYVEERATPNTTDPIAPEEPFAAVLELAGGSAERLGIAPGARLNHSLFASGE